VSYIYGWNMVGYAPDTPPGAADTMGEAREKLACFMETFAMYAADDAESQKEATQLIEGAKQIRLAQAPVTLSINGWAHWITKENDL
jgi:hypothetical protein